MLKPNKIILADGTELEGSIGYADKNLWLMLENITIPEAVMKLSNPDNTKVIKNVYKDFEDVYKDFTELNAVVQREESLDIRLIGGSKDTIEHNVFYNEITI